MKKKISVLVCSVAVSMSCSSSIDYPEPVELFEDIREVSGQEFPLAGLDVANPSQLLVFDSLLVIRDAFRKNDDTWLFALIDRHTGALVRLFGREGRGPDEFSDWTYIDRVPNRPDRVAINDRRLKSYHELSIPRIVSDTSGYTLQKHGGFPTVYQELHISYHLFAKIGENRLVGTGIFPEHRFGQLDTLGEIRSFLGSFPFEDQFRSVNHRDLGMAFQSLIRTHPYNPWMVAVTFASANLDILKMDGQTLQVAAQVHSWPAQFTGESTETQWSVRFAPENRAGYRDVDATNSYIYALFSGSIMADGWEKYVSGHRILVFDWKGNPIVQLNLDRAVNHISVDANDETLYGVTLDENDNASIVRFDLDI